MWSKLKQYFYNPTCFKCGSFFVEDHLFCETCFEKHIAPRAELKKRKFVVGKHSIDHFYLFDWTPGESDLLSRMVYQLKSDRCVFALNYYAKILIDQLIMQGFDQSQFLLVTALPGSKKSSCHSNILGEQVATHLKIQYQALFNKSPTQRSQKSKTLEQRKSTQVALQDAVRIEQITNYHFSKLKIMYVDDILTTGNTLMAARRALGCEKDACVMTLFYRPSVAFQIQRFQS